MIKGLIALALGALSFGVVEFVAMGLLPYFAEDFALPIATASHAISAYAFGVCAGVLYMVFTRKVNLKVSLCIVLLCHLLGIALTAISPNFGTLLLARFISGMPHGCFFGLGAIISMRIAKAGQGSMAMAIMLAGQSISIVGGVPLGTALAHAVSWRAIFFIMTAWALMVLIATIRWLPNPGKLEDHGFWGQFQFLKHKGPYLVGLSILLGNGGIFAIQSYVSPILTDFVGIPLVYVATVLIVMGIAMTVYNLIAGRLTDRFTPGKVSLVIFLSVIVTTLATFFWGDITVIGLILMIYIAGCLFGLSTPQQVSILRTSSGGELIGVAFGQVAFNFGNAVGAFFGGLPLDWGYNAQYVLISAGLLVVLGAIAMGIYVLFYEKNFTALFLKEQHERQEQALQEAKEHVAAHPPVSDFPGSSNAVSNNTDAITEATAIDSVAMPASEVAATPASASEIAATPAPTVAAKA